MSDEQETVCVVPSCGRPIKPKLGRGLCTRCYQGASFSISKGKTSWDELEQLGLALPTSVSPLTRALAAARKRSK